MSEATVIPPGGGEVIGDSPERRVEILSEHEPLHATWSRFGPGRDGADPHVHRHHTDVFYVLEGELTVTLGPEHEAVAVPAGTLARVPPLVVHGFRNASDGELRYLNLHAPGTGFADYMRGLRDGTKVAFDQHAPPDDGGRSTSEAAIGGTLFDGDGIALLADTDEIGIAELTAAASVPAHVHRRHIEAFYVLEGELALTLGDDEVFAAAGTWVAVPPGVEHALAVPDRARYLNVHAPNAGFGAFVRGDGAAFDQE
jgi:mannose-6-phosphate isomerase-like protein (cupin superfamily)